MGRPMTRTIELFKLKESSKVPKPTMPAAHVPPCHISAVLNTSTQGRGLLHPEQPWQPVPVPDTSQMAPWVCAKLHGRLTWGTAHEHKHWMKTFHVISGLKIFLDFRQLLHCISRNFYPKVEITAIKGKAEKWGGKQRRAPLLSPPLLPAPCEAAHPGNVLSCNGVCCYQLLLPRAALTSLISANKPSRASFVKAIPHLSWLWVSCSASIAHAPPTEYHQLPILKTTNLN